MSVRFEEEGHLLSVQVESIDKDIKSLVEIDKERMFKYQPFQYLVDDYALMIEHGMNRKPYDIQQFYVLSERCRVNIAECQKEIGYTIDDHDKPHTY